MSARTAGVARARSATLLLAALAMIVPVNAPATAQDVVSVIVVPGDPQSDATLRLGPAVQVVDGAEVSWRIVNGSDTPTEVSLALRRLDAAADGTVADGDPLALTLERASLRLDPGDGADVTVSRRAIADAITRGFALVVEGAGTPLRGVVVATRAAPDVVDVTLTRDDGRLRGSLTLSTDRALVTDLRARLISWPSRVVADTSLRDVVVLPGGRTVDLDLAGTAFVGPVDLEIVAGADDDTTTASARAWIVNRTAVRGVGTTVLVLTVLAMGLGLVRLRRGRTASAPAQDVASHDVE